MTSASNYDATGIEFYTLPDPFKFASGETVASMRVAYKSINPSAASSHGTVLIPTCFGGIINLTLNFTAPTPLQQRPGCLADYHVVVVAMMGNGESSSPSNMPDFPPPGELHYEDVVRSQYALVTQHLGLRELEAVVGFSMGAQQAYYWGVMYPNFVKRLVPICGSARTSPHNYSFLEGPIGALTNAGDFLAWTQSRAKGESGEKPERGLRAFGRAYNAWLTSAKWFREGWWGRKEDKETGEKGLGFSGVETWISEGSEAAFLDWSALDLLVLARMWQMGDVGSVIPGKESKVRTLGGETWDDVSYREALHSIEAKVLVMPCHTDQYFTSDESAIEMLYLKKGTFAPIESIWGHVAGGGMNPRDVEWMHARIKEFMDE